MGDERLAADVAELEAERDAKYREIRDAELDHRVGKLSEEDWRSLPPRLPRRAAAVPAPLPRPRARRAR